MPLCPYSGQCLALDVFEEHRGFFFDVLLKRIVSGGCFFQRFMQHGDKRLIVSLAECSANQLAASFVTLDDFDFSSHLGKRVFRIAEPEHAVGRKADDMITLRNRLEVVEFPTKS